MNRAGNYLLETVGGVWIASAVSRLVVDLNRGADRIDERVCPVWPGARVHNDGGVIPPLVKSKGHWLKLYNETLHPDEIETRLKQCWYPFHETLQHLLDQTIQQHHTAILISLHSTVPCPEHMEIDRPVLYMGTGNGMTCDQEILDVLSTILKKAGLTVVTDGYYQGAFTTQAFGVEKNINAIQIELDRRFLHSESQALTLLKPLSQTLEYVSHHRMNQKKGSPPPCLHPTRTYIDPISGEIFPS